MDSRISRRQFVKTTAAAGASALLLGGGSMVNIACMRAPLDLIIRNGSILDGSGKPAFAGDIAIRDGRIVDIGSLRGAVAERELSAAGLTVSPGFIDIHSHVDIDLFLYPRAESKVRQGVTTEVNGQDGDSPAPIGGPDMDRQLKNFREAFGFDCPYRDMDGFFRFLGQQRCAQNIVSFVGLGTIRGVIVGLDNRPATADEMSAMKREVQIAIEQGCWGASTGLEYTPGSFASTAELAECVSAAPLAHRLYATHMRNEDDTLMEAVRESIEIARRSGGRLQVSHFKASHKVDWPKQGPALQLLENAVAEGIEVHADRYPYIAYNTGLSNLFPLWSRDGGTEKYMARLRDKSLEEKIRGEVLKRINGLGSWDSVLISFVKEEEDRKYMGKTIEQISREEHVDPYELSVELLLREDGDVGMVGFGMDEEGTEMVLRWDRTMVASDAGASQPWGEPGQSRPHPRAYGTFPRAIARYVRERHVVTLPEMIRKMTSLPAAKLGLTDRGLLAKGNAADIVLFNADTIADRATFLEPHQFPVGIPYVIVNGVVVIDKEVNTGAMPGRVLRSA